MSIISDFATKPPQNDSPLKLALLIAILILATCARSAFGLGIELPDHDAFATARGNAFTATADDPAAVYYNPAGISQLHGNNISLGAYGLVYGDQYKGAAGTINSRTEWRATPDVFATFELPYHFTAGLGFYAPYGLVEEWPTTAPFSNIGNRGQIDYLTLNPVLSYEPIRGLSVAAGPTLNYSDADLRQYLYAPNALFPGSPLLTTHFHGNAEALGFIAAILYQPWEQHSFGVVYRNSTDMNYKGHADLPPPPYTPLGPGTASSADFKFPRSVDFGYSYRPTHHWNVELDGEWIDWASLNTLTLAGTGQAIPFNWKSTWLLKLGGTYYFGQDWRVSAGYMFVENSVPTDYFNPLIPDSDRHVFSVGIGKRYHNLSWDAAYQLAWGPSRSVSGDALGAGANGSYEFLSHAITINVGYHF